MKELKIGEEIRIRCVESKNSYCCHKCVFNPGDYPCVVEYVCDKGMRQDGKNVHFEIVEDKSEIIDEKKLDELSKEYNENSGNYIDVDAGMDITCRKALAFKAGFRKAMEK